MPVPVQRVISSYSLSQMILVKKQAIGKFKFMSHLFKFFQTRAFANSNKKGTSKKFLIKKVPSVQLTVEAAWRSSAEVLDSGSCGCITLDVRDSTDFELEKRSFWKILSLYQKNAMDGLLAILEIQ